MWSWTKMWPSQFCQQGIYNFQHHKHSVLTCRDNITRIPFHNAYICRHIGTLLHTCMHIHTLTRIQLIHCSPAASQAQQAQVRPRLGEDGQSEKALSRAGKGCWGRSPEWSTSLWSPSVVLRGSSQHTRHTSLWATQKTRSRKENTSALLGLCRVVIVGQRRQGWKAAPPPGARPGLHAPLLFIFTQNTFGFFCIPQGVFSIFFFQPLPILEKLETNLQCHPHPHMNSQWLSLLKQWWSFHMEAWKSRASGDRSFAVDSQWQARETAVPSTIWVQHLKNLLNYPST